MVKAIVLVVVVLLALFFLFPERMGELAQEGEQKLTEVVEGVTGGASSPSSAEEAPAGAEIRPSDTTELELELIEAARAGDEPRALALLSRGANVNGRDGKGETPLIAAASADKEEMMRLLLGEAAEPDGRDSRGRTALLISCSRGRTSSVRMLLAAGADPNLGSKAGNFPLVEAARYDDAASVRALLDAGADVNQRASNGWTALRAAEERGHSHVAELLRRAGGSQ